MSQNWFDPIIPFSSHICHSPAFCIRGTSPTGINIWLGRCGHSRFRISDRTPQYISLSKTKGPRKKHVLDFRPTGKLRIPDAS